MEVANTGSIRDNLDQEVVGVFMQTIGRLFESETQRYTELSKKVSGVVNKYIDKCRSGKEITTISQFLFESLRTNQTIQNLLEETLEENPDPKFSEALAQFKEEIIALFGIPDPDDQPEPNNRQEQNQDTPYWKKLWLSGRPFINEQIDRFRKKQDTGNLKANMILEELVILPLKKNQPLLDAYYLVISQLLKELWDFSGHTNHIVDQMAESGYELESIRQLKIPDHQSQRIDELAQKLQSTEKELLNGFEETITSHSKNTTPHTQEQPGNKVKNHQQYSSKNIVRTLERRLKDYSQSIHNWHNTLFVLSDDWKLELEISVLKYNILKNSFDFSGYVKTKFRHLIDEQIQMASNTVKELITLFEHDRYDKPEAMIKAIKTRRTDAKRKLMLKMVPEVKKIILDSNVPARIDQFEQATVQQFESLSKNRFIKKSADYSEPTSKSELDKISPHTLVAFQMMPEFMDTFPALKQGFTRHLLEIQNGIEEIPEIIDYSLQSSVNYFEEKKNMEDAEKIGLDGIKRAENKIEDINRLLDTFVKEESDRLESEIEQLTENLAKITDNESALQINLRITKARAVEKSKAIRKRVVEYIRGFLPKIVELFQKFVLFLRESSIRIRKQFTLEDKKTFISTDISDYLTETEKAIDRLPFIYQRLFRIEPLNSFELYTKREEAIGKIKTAYSRWKDGKFAPAVIIAEKGWGKTSLLNRFLTLKLTTEEVLTFVPDPDGDMEKFLHEIRSKTELTNDTKNDGETSEKRVIAVIDGLEKLFESRINGFDYLLEILKHISDTNSRVFWLTTCHLYSWDYLDKTVGISDYFGYHVRLPDFTDEELTKTILRRHNISGYRLMFLPETQKKALISFKKQADFGDQEELRNQYFARMHKIVKGNLAQAFLFWMRSTAQVTDDAVYIEYLSSDYFNFLGSMSDGKLMILKNIVLHNGISAEKHARLFRIPVERSKLLIGQLYDDGIVVKTGNIYNVNPIIYRQVIDHMYLLNILH